MKNQLLKVVAAITLALVASPKLSSAVVYSPSEFNTELKAKVGTKKDAAAYKAAAKLYKSALTDKKNKKNADKYAKSIVSLLKKQVKKDQGKSVNTLVKALLDGYFKGIQFNLTDSTYDKALKRLLNSLPPTQKTQAVSQEIYDTIKTYALSKGSTQSQVFSYFTSIDIAVGLPVPGTS